MRGLIAFSLPLLAAAAPSFSTETIHKDAAPVLSSTNSEVVPDSYIVVFKKHVDESSAAKHHSWVQDIHSSSQTERSELRKRSQFPITTDIFKGLKHTYNVAGGFLGYSGHFDESVIDEVRRHPDVSKFIISSLRRASCSLGAFGAVLDECSTTLHLRATVGRRLSCFQLASWLKQKLYT
jgi:hypothetical protein